MNVGAHSHGSLPAQEAVALGHAAREREHERDRHLRRRVGEHVGRVRDDNPAALAFLEIDVVETDGVVGDDAELRPGGIQQLGVDAVGQHGHEAVRACDALEEVGPRGRRLLVVNIDHERLLECESYVCGHSPRDEDSRLHAEARWIERT